MIICKRPEPKKNAKYNTTKRTSNLSTNIKSPHLNQCCKYEKVIKVEYQHEKEMHHIYIFLEIYCCMTAQLCQCQALVSDLAPLHNHGPSVYCAQLLDN